MLGRLRRPEWRLLRSRSLPSSPESPKKSEIRTARLLLPPNAPRIAPSGGPLVCISHSVPTRGCCANRRANSSDLIGRMPAASLISGASWIICLQLHGMQRSCDPEGRRCHRKARATLSQTPTRCVSAYTNLRIGRASPASMSSPIRMLVNPPHTCEPRLNSVPVCACDTDGPRTDGVPIK